MKQKKGISSGRRGRDGDNESPSKSSLRLFICILISVVMLIMRRCFLLYSFCFLPSFLTRITDDLRISGINDLEKAFFGFDQKMT